MGPLVIGVLGFVHINIFITVDEEEIFDLRVLGFAYYIIFNSVFRKEVFDLRVLGRGRAGHFAI